MNFLQTIDWMLILRIILTVLLFAAILFVIVILYKNSNIRIIIARKDNYFKIRDLFLAENLKDNDFVSLINSIYKDMESVSIDKDTYVKKTGGAIQQISIRLSQLSESLTNLENENKNLKNRTIILDHKDKLMQIIILLEDVRKFKIDEFNYILDHVESNLITILTSFGVSEYTTEFLDDEILKYYIFDKEQNNKDDENFIVKKSGFFIERLDGVTVLKAATMTVKED